jgi:hypothetical protein
MSQGFVYILVSPNSNYIKIGGTEKSISKRLREINATAPYADHGPWDLSDFLHVTDWRLVEAGLHKHFKKKQIQDVEGTRELFEIPPYEARQRLRLVDNRLRIGYEKTEELFRNCDVRLFLFKLFQLSGLFGSLDIQGAWTMTILPSTGRGRWFTLNLGPHEVAFSERKPVGNKFLHYLVVDPLILEYPETIMWIGRRDGEANRAPYVTAERATAIAFRADFAEAEKVFTLPGVRRALIAYWFDRLADLRERDAKSVYARHHSYDAVSELLQYKRARENMF